MSDQPSLFADAAAPSMTLPGDWAEVLEGETSQPYFQNLMAFVAQQRETVTVYPPLGDMFTALRLTPYADVKVLVLGQDPYHGAGQAHGLSFSVRPGVRPPPSLANIYKELRDDVGFEIPKHGSLTPWAAQGVLLLNAVLTVRAGEPNSHAGQGWEKFTDAIIRALNTKPERVVFVLWGAYARKKVKLITGPQHTILESAHPSPLSVTKFMGSKPFSQTNAALQEAGLTPIQWQLPMQAEG
ncbi:uracil-DNA glycosylase [Deinococcus oregonensis]|uniref:Uracil-DNA glycosylase n=1 Tax=Deinococcus oregonensis TaxID=1805970 RepID=A0ABV6AT26_9DEIO